VSAAGLLRSFVPALDQADIPHMLTGSLAAAWYGAGRATLDIDLVVELQADRIGALVDAICRCPSTPTPARSSAGSRPRA